MGFKTSLVSSPSQLKPELLCCSCSNLVDQPVGLPCGHLACCGCVRSATTGRQRLFRCGQCQQRVDESTALERQPPSGVPAWITIELKTVRLACPKLCGAEGLKLSELSGHFADTCPRSEVECPNVGCGVKYRRDKTNKHQRVCQRKPVECPACSRQMLAKDLPGHQLKTGCHELQIKIQRKENMQQCHRQVLQHYRLLRQRSLLTMQELRKQELMHLHRMGVQGFFRKEALPEVKTVANVGGRVCERCGKNFSANHGTACRWHGGPIIGTFGGLCLACGKPSHTQGCIISAHAAAAQPTEQQDVHE